MTHHNKELEELENQIDKLEDNTFKKKLQIEFDNLKHFNGLSPCDGTWDSNQGKCIEEDETDKPPKVSAGSDQKGKLGNKVMLEGKILDMKSYLVYNNWSVFSGPSIELSITADGRSADFVPTVAGEYILEYAVRDIKGNVASDQIKITVKDEESEEEVRNIASGKKPTEQDKEKGLDKIVEELDKPVLEKEKPTTVDINQVDNKPKVNIHEEKKNSKITIKGDKKD